MGPVVRRAADGVSLQGKHLQAREIPERTKILRAAQKVVREGEANNAREEFQPAQRAQAVVAEKEVGCPGRYDRGNALEGGYMLAHLQIWIIHHNSRGRVEGGKGVLVWARADRHQLQFFLGLYIWRKMLFSVFL